MINPALNNLSWHAAQIEVFGIARQRRLANSKIVVVGCGRIGTNVVLGAHASGVGHLVCIDGQLIETEQLGPFVFSHPRDVGQPKVEVLARFLSPRHNGIVEAIASPVENAGLDSLLKDASLIISCANRVGARLFVERQAILNRVPVVQVAAFDSRRHRGGIISVSLPHNPGLACYGCLTRGTDTASNENGSALLISVTAILGHLAAYIATTLLVEDNGQAPLTENLFMINLEQFSIDALAVERRVSCRTCKLP
jgi:molybdopterin/thiamine biosynthesis adenylyltransferase